MIHLDPYNRVIEDCLNNYFTKITKTGQNQSVSCASGHSGSRKKVIDIIFTDFDMASYHLSSIKCKGVLRLSLRIPFFEDLQRFNISENLEAIYPSMVSSQPEAGYNISIDMDIAEIANKPAAQKDLFRKLARIKQSCFDAVLSQIFARLDSEQTAFSPTDIDSIPLREGGEKMYIKILPDKILVILCVLLRDLDDAVICKVFLQELSGGRKNAYLSPQVYVSHGKRPLELKSELKGGDDLSFITFVLSPAHIATQKTRDNTIDMILSVRHYLQYHIKCTKASIHSRIRQKTGDYIQAIQQARSKTRTTASSTRNLKTISGRTFIPRQSTTVTINGSRIDDQLCSDVSRLHLRRTQEKRAPSRVDGDKHTGDDLN